MKIRFPKSRVGWIFVTIYLVISLFSGLLVIICGKLTEGRGLEVIGCSVFLLPALPWLFLLLSLVSRLGETFFPGFLGNTILIPLLFSIAVIINAIILYWIVVGLKRLFVKRALHKEDRNLSGPAG